MNGSHEIRSVARSLGRQKNEDCLAGNAAGFTRISAAALRVIVRRACRTIGRLSGAITFLRTRCVHHLIRFPISIGSWRLLARRTSTSTTETLFLLAN